MPVRGHLIAYRLEPGVLDPILRHNSTYLLQRRSGSAGRRFVDRTRSWASIAPSTNPSPPTYTGARFRYCRCWHRSVLRRSGTGSGPASRRTSPQSAACRVRRCGPRSVTTATGFCWHPKRRGLSRKRWGNLPRVCLRNRSTSPCQGQWNWVWNIFARSCATSGWSFRRAITSGTAFADLVVDYGADGVDGRAAQVAAAGVHRLLVELD